jgi:drug/metabolite transporter (DMT)-like permease
MVLAGLTNVLAKIATKRLSGPFVSSFRMIFGWITIMVFVRVYSWQGVSKVWGMMILSALLAYGFMVCLFWGIKLTTPTTAGVIYLSEVIFTSILAIVILGETLSLVQWLGGLLGGAAIVGFALSK